MRIAVLSDVHGNLAALEAILRDADRNRVEQYWFLGDLIGYGPNAWECYDRLMKLRNEKLLPDSAWLAGNQDLIFSHKLIDVFINPDAKWTHNCTRDEIERKSQEEKDGFYKFLARRPFVHESPVPGIWLMHGTAYRKDQTKKLDKEACLKGINSYIQVAFEDSWKIEESWETMSLLSKSPKNKSSSPTLILGGHTHFPLLWRRQDTNGWEADPPDKNPPPIDKDCPRCHGRPGSCPGRRWQRPIQLDHRPTFINPGSVGQPRDECPMPAYLLLNLEYPLAVSFQRVYYNVNETIDGLNKFQYMSRSEEHIQSLAQWLNNGWKPES